MILSEDNFKQIFAFADRNSRLAKLLYNAALFRIRQVFTGWNKEERTDLEKSVFAEIQCAKETYKDFTCRRVFSYKALDRTLRANKNPDFFAGLSMQTAQSIVRQATIDFKAWLDALKVYKKDPSSFTGRPRMPKYCRLDKKTFKVTNQDAILYPAPDGKGCLLKLPNMTENRIAGDFIPVYGKVKGHPVFSGRRVERGLYLCKDGYCINADCNGAANILRKAFPDAWAACEDYHFLASPDVIGFKDLNPAVFPDRQRQRNVNKKN